MKQLYEDYSAQKKIIDSFKEPLSDFDRTDYNYICNKLIYGKNKKIVLYEICSLFAIPVFIIIYTINRIFIVKDKQQKTILIESTNRKGQKYNFDGRLPDFDNSYQPIKIMKMGTFPKFKEGVIGKKAFLIFLKYSIRHPFNFFNNFRCLVNIMGYNKLLVKFSPKAIVNSRMELNHMANLITLLCEENKCEFINLMHGEVLYNVATSFVRFSKFYIWDEHYIDVFSWGRCPVDQFEVYQPEIFNLSLNKETRPEYYITYIFLGDEKAGCDKNAPAVREILKKFVKQGKKCKIRPHPRWSDIEQLKQIFADTEITIEDPRKVNVAESLTNTEMVVGTFSTVMSEAFYSHKKIVLDDVSDKDVYQSLFERGYILINKPHELLSCLISK